MSATGVVTHDPPLPTTYTVGGSVGNTHVTRILAKVDRVVEIPLTCDAIYGFDAPNSMNWESNGFVPLTPNPDIAGFGVSDTV